MDTATGWPTSGFTMSLSLWLVGLVLVAALATDQSMLALLCLSLIAVMAGAKAWSRLSLRRVTSVLHVDRSRVFAGEALHVQAEIRNAKPLPIWLQARLAHGPELRVRGEAQPHAGLAAYQQAAFTWQIEARRRGVHRLGPLELQASDPLGFYEEQTPAASHEVVVFPRLHPLAPFTLPRRELYGRPGIHSPFEDPTYLSGVREYQGTRAARYIHWKASARHARLLEKMVESSQQESVLLLLDTHGFDEDPTGEAFERCLEVIASLAVHLDRRRCPVGLTTNASVLGGLPAEIRPTRSPGQLSRLLEMMARLEPRATGELIERLQHGFTLPWTSTVVCFAHRFDASHVGLQHWLGRRKIPLASVFCVATPAAWEEHRASGCELHALDALVAGSAAAPHVQGGAAA